MYKFALVLWVIWSLGCQYQRTQGFKTDPATFLLSNNFHQERVRIVSVDHIAVADGEASSGWNPIITKAPVTDLWRADQLYKSAPPPYRLTFENFGSPTLLQVIHSGLPPLSSSDNRVRWVLSLNPLIIAEGKAPRRLDELLYTTDFTSDGRICLQSHVRLIEAADLEERVTTIYCFDAWPDKEQVSHGEVSVRTVDLKVSNPPLRELFGFSLRSKSLETFIQNLRAASS